MLMAVKTRKTEVRRTKTATRRAQTATTKRVTTASTKRPATATTRAGGKNPGDVIGLSGARPPKSGKPVKPAAGKKSGPKGIEVESDRTRSASPPARVRM
jgi:hypothetical protein